MSRHRLEVQKKPARSARVASQSVSDEPTSGGSSSTAPKRRVTRPSVRVPAVRVRGFQTALSPVHRTGAWIAGLAVGAVLLLILGLGPAIGALNPAGSAYNASDGLGGDSAAGLYADEDLVAGKELSAAEAAKRLDQLRASRATRPAEPAAGLWVNPLPTAVLTSCFCARWGTFHWGIDLAAPIGTPFYAAGDGVVLKAGPASGFGNAIYIQHENGDVSIYGHEYEYEVEAGDIVHAGDEIGLVGSEGQSTGPHLHFEIHVGGIDGTRVDPIPWLAERGVIIQG